MDVSLHRRRIALRGLHPHRAFPGDSRRKEREAFYKAETLRRITESSSDGAKAAAELLRDEARREAIKTREGLKIGGLICIGVGVGLIIFLRVLLGSGGVPNGGAG